MIKKLGDKIPELEQSEERYRSLISCAIDAIVTFDEFGMITSWNEAAENIFGYKLDEVLGKPLSLLVPDELREEQDTIVVSLNQKKQTGQIHTLRKSKTGDLIPVAISFSPMKDKHGKELGVSAIIRDMTERKQMEAERKQAELRIQQLNRTYAILSDVNEIIVRETNKQAMLEAVCRIAIEKGDFLMAWIGWLDTEAHKVKPVASAGKVDGYLEMLDIDLSQDPSHRGPTSETLHTGFHTICPDIANDPRFVPRRDHALRRGYRASASFPLKIEGKPVAAFNLYSHELGFFEDPEEVRLLDKLAMDISFALEVGRRETERRSAEEELLWRTAFFEAQVDSALDGMLVVDNQGNKILQNRRMNELWKIPPHIAEDKDDTSQVQFVAGRTKNPKQFSEKVAYLYSHPEEISRDVIELVDETVLDRTSFPVKDKNGKYYGRIWTFRDITKQRQLEEQFRQAQKMEAIGQLAGGIAHDFNNILAVIMIQTELLTTIETLPSKVHNGLEEIRAAAEGAANLTRQLLLFSRRQVMQPRELDLNQVVTSLAKMLQRIIGEDVRLQLRLHPTPLVTNADAGMLDQVLMNLAVNARDAMPGGGRLLIETTNKTIDEEFARLHPDAKPGDYACLSVTDSGSGIAPDVLLRIFEPFFTTKDAGKGTGLGLATVFGIVKQHHGWITVESEIGKGSTFRVSCRHPARSRGAQATTKT